MRAHEGVERERGRPRRLEDPSARRTRGHIDDVEDVKDVIAGLVTARGGDDEGNACRGGEGGGGAVGG
ncbi:MAG TPA: hypothetical protein VIJ22_20545, partial [Polyangiaceae bacterium]